MKIVHFFKILLPMNPCISMVEFTYQIKQVLARGRYKQYETKIIIYGTCSINDGYDGRRMWQQG